VDGGLLQVDDAGPTEVRSELAFDGRRIDVDPEAPRTDPERAAVEVGIAGERTNRIELAGGHFLADDVREAQTMDGSLDRSGRIEAEHLRVEHGGANLDPLRGECGEGLRAGKGRMLPRQFDAEPDGPDRILSFAVTSGWRRQGLGRQMMDGFIQSCLMRGIRRIELEGRVSNEEAIRFYKPYGFELTSALPKFYTDGEDGYKMLEQ